MFGELFCEMCVLELESISYLYSRKPVYEFRYHNVKIYVMKN